MTNSAAQARNLAHSIANAAGCMLEPNLSRPGARTLRMQVQAPGAWQAVAFRADASRILAAAGFAADVEAPLEERTPGTLPYWTVLVIVTVEA